jgi:hypothetical protein
MAGVGPRGCGPTPDWGPPPWDGFGGEGRVWGRAGVGEGHRAEARRHGGKAGRGRGEGGGRRAGNRCLNANGVAAFSPGLAGRRAGQPWVFASHPIIQPRTRLRRPGVGRGGRLGGRNPFRVWDVGGRGPRGRPARTRSNPGLEDGILPGFPVVWPFSGVAERPKDGSRGQRPRFAWVLGLASRSDVRPLREV